MSRSYLLLALLLAVLPLSVAHGATPQSRQPAQAQPVSQPQPQLAVTPGQPDLISFGVSYVDFDKENQFGRDSARATQGTDVRLEYRFGYSLWSAGNSWIDFGIHPMLGGQVSSHKQLYGFGGFAFDALFWNHIVLTESEVVGLFGQGNAKPLGSMIEFRSQMEAGYRFDNDMRITAQISHISNAGIGKRNPGEEMVGGYIHVPFGMLFGH